ncbi:MAG TPA: hypothetical protein P5136_01555 [Methanofastidiosum sp.]|nr:hypothetical protein [Methanofastidiosum sp.]
MTPEEKKQITQLVSLAYTNSCIGNCINNCPLYTRTKTVGICFKSKNNYSKDLANELLGMFPDEDIFQILLEGI